MFGSVVEMKAHASLVVSIPISYSVETKDFAFRSQMYFEENLRWFGSELHVSPHIYIWIKTFHIWIYMEKTILECALYVG